MAGLEQSKVLPLSDRLSGVTALDILEKFDPNNPRETSSLLAWRLEHNPPSIKGQEQEIAQQIGQCLTSLRMIEPEARTIYNGYAQRDFLGSLAGINHPSAQMLIAQSIAGTDPFVGNTAISLLLRPNPDVTDDKANKMKLVAKDGIKVLDRTDERRKIGIFPQTFAQLFSQPDYWPIALLVIEKNPMVNQVCPEVEEGLGKIFQEGDQDIKVAAAIAGSVLHKKSGGLSQTLVEQSLLTLSQRLAQVVGEMSVEETFRSVVWRIATDPESHKYARAIVEPKQNSGSRKPKEPTKDEARKMILEELPLTLPKDIEGEREMAAVMRLMGDQVFQIPQAQDYQMLTTLMVVRAREELANRIGNETEIAQHRVEQERVEEEKKKREASDKAAEKQKQKEEQRRYERQQIEQEKGVIGSVVDRFPSLRN